MERMRRRERDRHQEKAPSLQVERGAHPISQDPPDPLADVQVRVIFGASVQSFPLAGLTVSQARHVLEPILRIDPATPVMVNGRRARTEHELSGSDTLEFVHHAGEKGGHADGHPHRAQWRAGRL